MSLNFTQLKTSVGFFMGFGPGDNNAQGVQVLGYYGDSTKAYVVSDCLRGGLKQVVTPPVLPGEMASYEWSWADPTSTLTLLQGTNSVQLPDDFGAIEGGVFLSDAGGDIFEERSVVNDQMIFAKQALNPTLTARPMLFAVSPIRGTTATVGQRFQLLWYPIADQTYTAKVDYYFLENALNGTNPFPPGGAWLAETINASCKAYAEVHYQNIIGGPMFSMFMQSLTGAIAADRRNKPQRGGYNGDRSDEVFNRFGNRRLHQPTTVTYAGDPSGM